MVYENPRNSPGERLTQIQVDGTSFSFIRGQRSGSAVYKSADSFLRIGDAQKINASLELHKRMEHFGFPVAPLLAEGIVGGQQYYIETSLGEKHLGELFAEDMKGVNEISEATFRDFLDISEKFARAQLNTKINWRDYEGFSKGIHLDSMCEELPEYAESMNERFSQVKQKTASLPFVLTHGDFNPNNLYPDGVIDFEDSFYAPYGYDQISAITHINYFPDDSGFEHTAGYRFTEAQRRVFLERMDTIWKEAGLPALSEFEQDFEYCRALWLAAKIPQTPKLQGFRYNLLIHKFLNQ